MEKSNIIENAKNYIREFFRDESTGHDYYHIMRVYKLAVSIAQKENADMFIVELAAILHDVDDSKIVGKDSNNAYNFLKSQDIDEDTFNKVMYIIENQSYRKTMENKSKLKTIEAMIVQDADRLDGIGAIGIARVFTYGGGKNRQIYDPNQPISTYMTEEQYVNNKSTSINHFYEKLLKLKDLMNTSEAKKLAENRHRFMEEYLQEFFDEWEGKK